MRVATSRLLTLAVTSSLLFSAERKFTTFQDSVRFEHSGAGEFIERVSGIGVNRNGIELMPGSAPVSLKWVGGRQVVPEGVEPSKSRNLYYIGGSRGSRGGAQYDAVRYRQVWNGIDVMLRGKGRDIEYDFLVAPQADPNQIRIEISGVRKLSLQGGREMLLDTGNGVLRQRIPAIYQDVAGQKRLVAGGFKIVGPETLGFQLAGYDRRHALIIDPVIETIADLRADGSVSISSVAQGPDGITYVAGHTSAPSLAGRRRPGGNSDAFVARVSRAGEILSVMYLGGSGQDAATGLAVDALGNVYVTGWTTSLDFPVVHGVQSRLSGGRDGFIAKLDNYGNLLFSTYIGGSGDDEPRAIAVDGTGAVYLAGTTRSADFPVYRAAQYKQQSKQDAFALKLSPSGESFAYATYVGGVDDRSANALVVDGRGRLMVAGAAGRDAFVTAISADGQIEFTVPLGGTGTDFASAVAVDASGRIWVLGETTSDDFPVAGGFQAKRGGATDGFLTQLDGQGKVLFSSYLGGAGDQHPTALAIAGDGSVAIAGWQRSRAGVEGFTARIAYNKLAEWSKTTGSGLRLPRAMALAANGDLLMAGDAADNGFPFGFLARLASAVRMPVPETIRPAVTQGTRQINCGETLTPITPTIYPASGGRGSAALSSPCNVAPSSVVTWVALPLDPPGSNPILQYRVMPNPGPARTVNVTLAGASFNVSQNSGVTCTYTMTATGPTSFGAGGGQGSLAVSNNDATCGLYPSSSDPWVVADPAPSGTSGTVLFTVLANSGVARSATLTLGTQTVNVTQAAGPLPVQNWVKQFPAANPPSATGAPMVYDSQRQEVVAYISNQTWIWNGITWTKRNPVTSPPARTYPTMAYDAAHGQTVLYAGGTGLNDTWVWDGVNWAQKTPVHSPGFPVGLMAYDLARGQAVLVSKGTPVTETWVWDGADWTQKVASLPGYLSDGSLINDPIQSRIILLFNDFNSAATYTWDGAGWTFLSSAPANIGMGIAYDAPRNQVVGFGGAINGQPAVNTTFLMAPVSPYWSQATPTTSPIARSGASMAYHSARREIVMFGGSSAETWVYRDALSYSIIPPAVDYGTVTAGTTPMIPVTIRNLGASPLTVTSLTMSGGPFSISSPPTLPAIVFPNATLVLPIVFNAAGGSSYSSTLSIITDAGNSGVTITGTIAPYCNYTVSPLGATAFAATGGDGYLSAVMSGNACPGAIPASSGALWATIVSRPGGSTSGTVVYRVAPNTGASRNTSITVGSVPVSISQSDGSACTFTLSATSPTTFSSSGGQGTAAVTTNSSSCGLTPASNASWLISDPAQAATTASLRYFVQANGGAARSAILTLGSQTLTVTQETGPAPAQAWRQLSPATTPTVNNSASAAYDSARKEVVMYNNATYAWDGANWNLRAAAAASPSARGASSMAYDPIRGQTVFFGGVNGTTFYNETWVWDGASWTKKTPLHSPSVRVYAAMAFDPLRGNVVLAGGSMNSTGYYDTWTWDGTDWTQAPNGNVSGITQKMVYDAGLASIVAISNTGTYLWDGTKWWPLGSSNYRGTAGLVYDAARDQIVQFSGLNGSNASSELFVASSTALPAWTTPSLVPSPAARMQAVMVYDAARRQTLLWGGWGTSRLI